MPERVRITDVSPRDGLQNETGRVPAEEKAELVRLLAETGVDEIEVTSFVSPRWVPQLGDADELCAMLTHAKPPGVCFSALVPNERGLERLLAVNDSAAACEPGGPLIDKVSVFTAASEGFSRKNTNASIDETIERFRPVIAEAARQGLATRGYISCAVECPFDGPTPPESVARVAGALLELGVDELDLGDTIGEGTPRTIAAAVLAAVEALGGRRETPRGEPSLTLHLHDTFGRAEACIREALTLGVRSFDGAAGGIGGCPFASTPERRAPGNVATSLVVRTAEAEGCVTGVNLATLAHAATAAERMVTAARMAAIGGGDTGSAG